jgi:hypothetical protein
MVAFAYNTSNHETTKLPPFMIIHGRDARFPFEIGTRTATYVGSAFQVTALALDIESHFKQVLDLARENIGLAQHKMTLRADKTKPRVEYRVGEKVWLFTPQVTKTKLEDGTEIRLAKKLKFPWQGPYEVTKQLTPNTVDLQYRDGHRLGQSVHVNQIKPYKERQPIEESHISNEDTFDPAKEKMINTTTTVDREVLANLEGVEVKNITGYHIKKGKLEYLTTYKDGTTSWQPEDNFIGEDGTTTEAIKEYYTYITDKKHPALYAQIEKFARLFKSPKIPLNTVIYQLLGILGKKSTYFFNTKVKEYFHKIIKNTTTMKRLREFLSNLLENWTKWMDIYEENEYEEKRERKSNE